MSDSHLADVAPSVELVRALVGLERSALDVDLQLAAVAGWERVVSWASAMQAELLVDVDRELDARRYGWAAADVARATADQLGLALGVSGPSAQRRVNTAAIWVEKTPAVHTALKTGQITQHHARKAASAAAVLDPQVAQAVAAATMTDDGWRTPSQFEETFHRYVLELDAEGAGERHRAARRTRRVSRRTEPHGMGSLWALLPAEDNEAVWARVDACARSSLATNRPGDERTLDERRADALVQLICGQISNGHRGPGPADGGEPGDGGVVGDGGAVAPSEPTVQGRHARICVTVAWSTLIGLDDAPAHLAGYGLIDAATARRISADPTSVWYRLLTDPASGRLLDYGRTVYRPPQDLRDFVIARDRCCRFPSCDRPAQVCDLDHRQDWVEGGTTCRKCLDALCRRHHKLKHQGGWVHVRDPESEDSWWIDPAGDIHLRPATVLPNPAPVEPPRAPESASERTPATAPALVPAQAEPDDAPPPF